MITFYAWCIATKVNDWWFLLSLCFCEKLIYQLNMSFAHHICCCFIFCNNEKCFFEQKPQLARFLVTWFYYYLWLLCEVTVEKRNVYCWQCKNSVDNISTFFLWTSVDTVDDEVFSHLAYYVVAFRLKYWCPASGWGQYRYSEPDIIINYTNKLLTAVRII